MVLAATHCFDDSLIETVVKGNINPVDKVERSSLIVASTIHNKPAAALIHEAELPRVQGLNQHLFLEA